MGGDQQLSNNQKLECARRRLFRLTTNSQSPTKIKLSISSLSSLSLTSRLVSEAARIGCLSRGHWPACSTEWLQLVHPRPKLVHCDSLDHCGSSLDSRVTHLDSSALIQLILSIRALALCVFDARLVGLCAT